jgi:hypothetical protein
MPREVVVPRPFVEMSTGRMLVMELLPGPKLTTGLRRCHLRPWSTLDRSFSFRNLSACVVVGTGVSRSVPPRKGGHRRS